MGCREVSAAIKLFVARHSTASSPFLITFPPANCPTDSSPENVITNPMFLQQRPSEPTQETIACESSDSSTSSEYDEEDKRAEPVESRNDEQPCGYFYMSMPPPMPSPQRDFGWDFFNPFAGVRPEVIGGYPRNSDDDLRVVREEEGIPDLEEEGGREAEKKVVAGGIEENSNVEHLDSEVEVEKAMDGRDVSPKGLTVIDTPVRGRELLDALKDIEDHFIRAFDSGKDVSRMLEANKFHLQSGFEEIKGRYALPFGLDAFHFQVHLILF
ncbi:hypothetical protein Ancab_028117 [Ancistrocladus abbreviatus]